MVIKRIRTRWRAGAAFAVAMGVMPLASCSAREAVVTDVIDGDTIIVDMDTRVQLLGVDALGEPTGDYLEREKDWLAASFTSNFLKGRKIRLEFDPANRLKNHLDRWDRLLAYVYLPDGTLFNLAIVEQGYASAYVRYPFDMKEKLALAEKEARRERRGLWEFTDGGVLNKIKRGNARKIYVARKGSGVYHEAACLEVRDIPLEERITFHEAGEAEKLGYHPDRWCVPVLMKRFWGK